MSRFGLLVLAFVVATGAAPQEGKKKRLLFFTK